MNSKKLIIYGASYLGIVTLSVAKRVGFEEFLFFDDYLKDESYNSIRLLRSHSDVLNAIALNNYQIVAAIGNSSDRSRVTKTLTSHFDCNVFAKLIDPSACVSDDVHVGPGSIVLAGATVAPTSVLKPHCVVNSNATIGAGVCINACTTLGPNSNIGSGSTLGERCSIGMGACVLPNVNLGTEVVLGALSLATEGLSYSGTYVGSPAKRLVQ